MSKLTKRVVDATAPQSKPIYVWDDQLPGFGLKVLPRGSRRYLVKYRVGGGRKGRQRWYTLGTHGALTCEQARDQAQQILAAVARGEDPQANRVEGREAPTVVDLWKRYKREHLPRKKPSSHVDDEHKAHAYILPALGRYRVHDVTRQDVHRLHQSLSDRPYQANRVLALLSKMCNLAEAWGMRPEQTNPCRHVEKFRERARERYLRAEEIRRLHEALEEGLRTQSENPYIVAAIRLLLLTGARVNEILTARWEWVDWERNVLALPDSKTGSKSIYLSDPAVAVLTDLRGLSTSEASPYIIRGRRPDRPLINLSKPWQRVRERAGLDDVRLHDLRHTAASIGVGQGMSLAIIGRLLGHTQASTTQRYAHVDIDPALAAANQIGQTIANAWGREDKEDAEPL